MKLSFVLFTTSERRRSAVLLADQLDTGGIPPDSLQRSDQHPRARLPEQHHIHAGRAGSGESLATFSLCIFLHFFFSYSYRVRRPRDRLPLP